MLHRNSQKRTYIDDAIYFLTTNTHQSYPYFKYDVLCDLFVDVLMLSKQMKGFKLHGYKINPDHVHLLLQPNKTHNYSQIMGTLKRNYSRECNELMNDGMFVRKPQPHRPGKGRGSKKGDDSNRRLFWTSGKEFIRHIEKLQLLRNNFFNKYGNKSPSPLFKWQKSFHHHIIVNNRDFRNHLQYIQNQWIKHNLPENKYCFVAEEII